MPNFGSRSLKNLEQCHPDLQRVLNRAIESFDFTVIQGHRTEQEQHLAYKTGNSKLDWPHSRHNTLPSKAADCVPYFQDQPNIRWDDIQSFKDMAQVILAAADEMDIDLVWGGNWRMRDYPHFELVD